MKFYETYYYANVIHNILRNQFDWLVNLHQWHENHGEEMFLQHFNKWSVFHDFCYCIIDNLVSEKIDDIEEDRLCQDHTAVPWIDHALAYHNIDHDGFDAWLRSINVKRQNINQDTLFEYHQELVLTGEQDALITTMTNELFTVLFANRQLMELFNRYVSMVISRYKISEVDETLRSEMKSDGVVRRADIPEWVKKAVYYRERGKCAQCTKDLMGIVSIFDARHYDHIIPLAEGGINDITNIQLLCEACNLSKGRKIVSTSCRYEPWYEYIR